MRRQLLGLRLSLLAAGLGALLACFDGSIEVFNDTARLRVIVAAHCAVGGHEYVALLTRSGWEGWRDVFRSRDRLNDVLLVLRLPFVSRSRTFAIPSEGEAYAFWMRSSGHHPLEDLGTTRGSVTVAPSGRNLRLSLSMSAREAAASKGSAGAHPSSPIVFSIDESVAAHDPATVAKYLGSGASEIQPALKEWETAVRSEQDPRVPGPTQP